MRVPRRTIRALLLAVAIAAIPARAAADSILLYDTNSIKGNARQAVSALGLPFTWATSDTFASLMASGRWDLVIMDVPSTTPTGGFSPLVDYVLSGGRAVLSYWNLDTQPELQAAFGVAVTSSFHQPRDVYPWTAHRSLTTPYDIAPLTSWSEGWDDNGDALAALAGTELIAGFTTATAAGSGAIALGNGHRTFVNGFLFDDITDQNGVNLIANQVAFLLDDAAPVPEPGSMTLVALGLAAVTRRMARRRGEDRDGQRPSSPVDSRRGRT